MLYFYTLLSLLIIDAVWLYSMSGVYKKWIGHLMAPSFSLIPALFFYPLYAAGIVFFVVVPALRTESSLLSVFVTGAFLGLLAYGAYDLTNHATLRNWPLVLTIVDILWGAFVTGIVSFVAVYLGRTFG